MARWSTTLLRLGSRRGGTTLDPVRGQRFAQPALEANRRSCARTTCGRADRSCAAARSRPLTRTLRRCFAGSGAGSCWRTAHRPRGPRECPVWLELASADRCLQVRRLISMGATASGQSGEQPDPCELVAGDVQDGSLPAQTATRGTRGTATSRLRRPRERCAEAAFARPRTVADPHRAPACVAHSVRGTPRLRMSG